MTHGQEKPQYRAQLCEDYIKFYNTQGKRVDLGDIWPRCNRDDTNRSFNPLSNITRKNICKLEEVDRIPITVNPDGRADLWVAITADEENIYCTTHNETGLPEDEEDFVGMVFAVDRATNKVKWRRRMSEYSGIPSDYSRAGPAIYGDFIFFGSSIATPQTWEPFQDVVRRFVPGPVPFAPSGRRVRAYCVNKHTGDMVWERELGKVASVYSDPDNFLSITMCPLVVELDVYQNGKKVPVLIIATSSLQSYIAWLACADNNPFGPSIWTSNAAVRMTESGQVYFLDILSGASFVPHFDVSPPQYRSGDVLGADAIRPGQTTITLNHFVQAADLAGGGGLNPVSVQFEGTQNITWALYAGLTIPTPLDTIQVVDNTGAVVALVGGAVAGANLNQVVVNIDTTFTQGSTQFMSPNGNMYDTTNAAVKLNGDLGPARIYKRLQAGDSLDEQDAYEASYMGASTWGSTPCVNYDKCGNAIELYISTGQSHHIPVDESLAIRAVTIEPFDILNQILVDEEAFRVSPTTANLQKIRNGFALWLQNIKDEKAVPLSERGRRHYHNAAVGLDLRPGKIGQYLWDFKTIGYDSWHLGYQIEALRQVEGLPGVAIPGFSAISNWWGWDKAPDADFGECPYLLPKAGDNGEDLLALATKGGTAWTLRLDNLESASTITELHCVVLNSPGLLGASNFGSSADCDTLYTVQANSMEQSNTNLPFQTSTDWRSLNPQAQQFPPKLAWYPVTETNPATIVPFEFYQSYISAYEPATGEVRFEVAATPQNTSAPWVTSTGCPSSTKDLLFVPDGSGRIQIFDSRCGAFVTALDIGTGGITSPIIGKDKMYVLSGRGSFAGTYPDSNYAGAREMFVYELPKKFCGQKEKKKSHQCKHHCNGYSCKQKNYPCDESDCCNHNKKH